MGMKPRIVWCEVPKTTYVKEQIALCPNCDEPLAFEFDKEGYAYICMKRCKYRYRIS